MTDMSVTITVPLWLPVAYLAIGLLLWLPLEWLAWRGIASPRPRPPFWREFSRLLRRKPWIPLAMAVAWPMAVWEELT